MGINKIPLQQGVYYNSTFSCIESSAGDTHLTPNEKKILEIILDKRGRKETIINEIWHQQGIVVSESSYHQLVKMLRRKFIAAGLNSSCLKTIPRYGIVYVNEPVLSTEPMIEAPQYNSLTEKIKELLPQATGKDVHSVQARFKPLCQFSGTAATLYLPVLMTVVISLSIAMMANSFSSVYFRQVKQLDQVSYYAAPTALVSEALWQRIQQRILPLTREVYVATNGPKMWVAYCEKSIYKDNAPCAYEHFSMY